MIVYTVVLDDKRRAETLGWAVQDDGRLIATRPNGPDSYVIALVGGDDDGHLVNITITYQESRRTGVFRFLRAEADWPRDDVTTRITTQTRLRQLVEAYAPGKQGV